MEISEGIKKIVDAREVVGGIRRIGRKEGDVERKNEV